MARHESTASAAGLPHAEDLISPCGIEFMMFMLLYDVQ